MQRMCLCMLEIENWQSMPCCGNYRPGSLCTIRRPNIYPVYSLELMTYQCDSQIQSTVTADYIKDDGAEYVDGQSTLMMIR